MSRQRMIGSSLILGIVTVAGLAYANLAMHKPFWMDEGYDVIATYSRPWLETLLKGGYGQCSPAPLYYLLQKPLATLTSWVAGFDERILVQWRWISIGSAMVSLGLLSTFLRNKLGLAWGLLGLAMVLNQPAFKHYAVENRPYLLWVVLLVASLLVWISLALKPWRETSRLHRVCAFGFLVALSMVASPGMIEGAGVVFAYFLFRRRSGRLESLELRFLAGSFLALLGTGLYYSLQVQGCTNPPGGQVTSAQFRSVLGLLLPESSLRTQVLNALLIVGAFVPLYLWRRPSRLGGRSNAFFLITLNALGQIGAGIIIGLLVWYQGYYFIWRTFIFLVICRALLVSAGAAFLFELVSQKLGARWKPYLEAGALVLALVALIPSVRLHIAVAREPGNSSYSVPPLAEHPCQIWEGEYHVLVPENNLSHEIGFNLIARVGEEMKRCGYHFSTKVSYILAPLDTASVAEPIRILESPPAGAVALKAMGELVVIGRLRTSK